MNLIDTINKDNLPKQLEGSGLKKALNVLDVMNFSDAEREDYEDHLKWLRIQANTMKKYKQDGIEEGEARGELNKAIAIAKNLVNLGLPIQDIINATGLTKEQISTINK